MSFDNKKIIIEHKGPLEYSTIGELINELKKKTTEMGVKLVIYKKLLLVMIETLENILRYNKYVKYLNNIQIEYQPSFTIEKIDDVYILTSSNAILNEDVSELREKLNFIKNLSLEQLKALYKETITNGQFTQSGGAGLGFIEIAKVTSGNIEYSFEPIDNRYSYYNFRAIIKN